MGFWLKSSQLKLPPQSTSVAMPKGDEPKPGDDSDKKIFGGNLIPLLHDLVTKVLIKLNYKCCFFGLLFVALIPWDIGFFGMLQSFGRAALVLFGGFFAIVASYTKRPCP